MTDPLISILVATRNPGTRFDGLVRSLNGQECRAFEVLVSDGGSTDRTAATLASGILRNLSWWRSQADLGVYDALNHAAAAAEGEWLIVLGGDDRLADDGTIEQLRCELEKTRPEVGLLYGNLFIKSSGVRRLKTYPEYETFIRAFG